jgi:hypothetical protein
LRPGLDTTCTRRGGRKRSTDSPRTCNRRLASRPWRASGRIDRHLLGKPDEVVAPLHRFIELVEACGPFEYSVTKTAISLKGTRRGFAGLKPRSTSLDGYLDLERRIEDPRIRRSGPYTKRLFVHQFRIVALAELDAEFAGCSERHTRSATARTSRLRAGDGRCVAHRNSHGRDAARQLVDVKLVEQRQRVVDRLEQILVVLDHLAAHVDAKPLLVDVQLVAVEHLLQRQIALREEPARNIAHSKPSEIDWK